MTLWFDLIAVILTAAAAWRLSARISPARWLWGTIAPAVILSSIFAVHRVLRLQFIIPFSWLANPHVMPLMMAGSLIVLFTTLMSRLAVRRTRLLAGTLAVVLVVYHALLPVATPLALRAAFSQTPTILNPAGICLQSTPYTCGPASAVTCLRSLGVQADEGALAIASRCQPSTGVDSASLASAITTLCGDRGVAGDSRLFNRIDDLPVPAVAFMRMPWAPGHDVAVLGITPQEVIIGDPETGGYRLSRADFQKMWTGVAVTVQRTAAYAQP